MSHFDIIVIGNGAVGHSLAHALATDSPELRIAVIGDAKRSLAASVAAGAMLGTYSEVTAAWRRSSSGKEKMQGLREAGKLWPEWLEGINSRIPKEKHVSLRPGTFVIENAVGSLLDTENYDAILATLDENREPYESVDPLKIDGLKPWVMARPLRAMYIPGEAAIESDRLLDAYVAAATTSSSIKLIDDMVLGLDVELSRVTGIRTASGALKAPKVILANGVGVQPLLDQIPSLSRRIPRIFSGGGTSLVFDPSWCYGTKSATIVPHVVRTPNRSFACGLHMIPRGSSHVYVGATNSLSVKPWSRPNLSDMHFLIECAMEQLNEDFVWSQLVNWYTGNRPVAIDACPILGRTSLEGLWIISGTFRDGLNTSPLLARQLVQELLHEKRVFPEIFRPERPPITLTRAEAVEEVVLHTHAAWFEHRAVNSTKMGLHEELPALLRTTAIQFYEQFKGSYVPPPEFFPLLGYGNIETTEFLTHYYAQTEKAWSGST